MKNRSLREDIRFLCIGAAGGNIGQMLEKKGFKAYYINLAKQDLDLINSPNKLHIPGGEGASKNRSKAKMVLSESIDEVMNVLDQQITERYVFVTFSLAGGTGSGLGAFVSSVIAENPDKKVGLVVILPSMGESLQARINAYRTFVMEEFLESNSDIDELFVFDQ